MLADTTTPDGYQVNADGVCTNPYKLTASSGSIKNYDNMVDDILSFPYNEEIVETPCKIYYNNYRYGKYTTVKYDSVFMQPWNGKSANLIINYTVEKTGGYNSTYFGCDVYVNGEKLISLGGPDGNEKIYFNQKITSIFIPIETFKPGDLIELHING